MSDRLNALSNNNLDETMTEKNSSPKTTAEGTTIEKVQNEETPVEKNSVEETPAEEKNKVVIATGDVVGKICSFCKTTINEGDEIIVCPACEQPHHSECWEENKGCSTFGCEYQNIVEKQENNRFCVYCGAELEADAVFCTKCGRKQEQTTGLGTQTHAVPATQNTTMVSIPQNPAAYTSRAEEPNAEQTKKKRKKKKIQIIIAVLLVIVATAGLFGYYRHQTKLENEYLENCRAFSSAVYSSGAKLEDIGKEELSCWYDYIWDNGYYFKKYYSVDDAVSTAQSNQSYNISQVESDDLEISSLYSSIISSPIADSKKSRITSIVKDVYDDYEEMYDSILEPEGNYSNFKGTYNSCDSNLADSLQDLSDAIQ